MFSSAANPYDGMIAKATDENLASEDWALNMEVCDKVSSEGETGARNALNALQKRLSHRNPNVQVFALELTNTIVQNCGKQAHQELASRLWTSSLDRLVNDRATVAPVKKKALGYIKAWAKQFEESGNSNLGLMGELYDQLRAKGHSFDGEDAAPKKVESPSEARRRQEDEELQRVLELSKQDKGGRSSSSQPAAAVGSSSSGYPQAPARYQPPPPEPEPPVLDKDSATRVRAVYTFTSQEVGELNFERGDVIKVLDRGFKEWWRGACNGRIGIFPVTYVEAMPEPSPRELQEEAQEEARVFASLGLVDQLLQTLKGIDPARGDRLDDRPEIEEMYQSSVALQGQINALIKKYSDQKAELEHMNANFLRAMKQYEDLRNPGPAGYYAHQADPYAPPQSQGYQPYPASQPQQPYPPQQASPYPQQPPYHSQNSFHGPPQAQHDAPPGPHQYQTLNSGAVDYPAHAPGRQGNDPGQSGLGAGQAPISAEEHKAAWDAYYAQQAQGQGQAEPPAPVPKDTQPEYQQAGYRHPGQGGYPGQGYPQGHQGVDGVAAQMNRMSMNGA